MNVTDSNLLTQVDIQSRDERSLAYLVGKRSWKHCEVEKFYVGNSAMKLEIMTLESSTEVGKFSIELQKIIEVA